MSFELHCVTSWLVRVEGAGDRRITGSHASSLCKESDTFAFQHPRMSQEDRRSDENALYRRAHEEMLDSFDEELEMEVDDDRLNRLLDQVTEKPGVQGIE